MADVRASGEEGLGRAGHRERRLPGKSELDLVADKLQGLKEQELLTLSPSVCVCLTVELWCH